MYSVRTLGYPNNRCGHTEPGHVGNTRAHTLHNTLLSCSHHCCTLAPAGGLHAYTPVLISSIAVCTSQRCGVSSATSVCYISVLHLQQVWTTRGGLLHVRPQPQQYQAKEGPPEAAKNNEGGERAQVVHGASHYVPLRVPKR